MAASSKGDSREGLSILLAWCVMLEASVSGLLQDMTKHCISSKPYFMSFIPWISCYYTANNSHASLYMHTILFSLYYWASLVLLNRRINKYNKMYVWSDECYEPLFMLFNCIKFERNYTSVLSLFSANSERTDCQWQNPIDAYNSRPSDSRTIKDT